MEADNRGFELATGVVGAVCAATATVLDGGFLLLARRLQRLPGPRAAVTLFKFSISYLSLLFAAMAADPLAQHIAGRSW